MLVRTSNSAEIFLLIFAVGSYYFQLTHGYLNLYISKEDLKNDLFLDFGNDLYVLTNGEPAPLLSNPKAFKNFIAPLTPFIEKIKFQWNILPPEFYSAASDEKIRYSFELSSSDTDVMAEPKATIPNSDVLPFKASLPEFTIEFPCTWKKYGLVDLGFHFNYTILNGSDISHEVVIVVRRHCFEIPHLDGKMENSSLVTLRHNTSISHGDTSIRKKPKLFTDNNVIIGIAVGCFTLFLTIIVILIFYYLRKKNRRLHLKFDIDYESKMKQEQENLMNNHKVGNNIPLKMHDNDEIFYNEAGKLSKPIYTPTTKKYRKSKWKKYRRRWHSNKGLSGSCNSDTSLENITEEHDELIENSAYGVGKGSAVILNLNLDAIHRNDSKESSLEGINNFNSWTTERVVSNLTKSNDENKDNLVANLCLGNSDIEKNNYMDGRSDKREVFISSDLLRVANYDKIVVDNFFRDLNTTWSLQFDKYLLAANQVVIDERFITKDRFFQIHRGKIRGLDKRQPNKVTPATVRIMTASPNTYYGKHFMTEASMMKNCYHENIMNLLGIVLHPSVSPLILTPHMRHSNLNQFLRSSRPTPRHHQALSTRQLINFAVQISSGMEYLADKGIVHQDLCCKNCMLDSSFTIKISGLGFAREVKKLNNNGETNIYQSLRWMAIESFTDNTFSEKSDVWSFGVVLWELMTFGKEPYLGLKDEEIKAYLLDYRRLSSPPNWPYAVCQIMFSCWSQTPKDRPNFSKLYEKLSAYEDKYKKYVSEYIPPVTEVTA